MVDFVHIDGLDYDSNEVVTIEMTQRYSLPEIPLHIDSMYVGPVTSNLGEMTVEFDPDEIISIYSIAGHEPMHSIQFDPSQVQVGFDGYVWDEDMQDVIYVGDYYGTGVTINTKHGTQEKVNWMKEGF